MIMLSTSRAEKLVDLYTAANKITELLLIDSYLASNDDVVLALEKALDALDGGTQPDRLNAILEGE